MEMSAEDQYEIYCKEHALMAQKKQPAKAEDLQKAIVESVYLLSMGMRVQKISDGYIVNMPAG